MVDEVPRPELADRQEARAGQELVVAPDAAAGRDERREREAGERVAGQEALGGEVAVAVEVALVRLSAVSLRSSSSCASASRRSRLACSRSRGLRDGVVDDARLLLRLAQGGAVQVAPAVGWRPRSGWRRVRMASSSHSSCHHPEAARSRVEIGEHRGGPPPGALAAARLVDGVADVVQQLQRRLVADHVEHVGERARRG